VCSWACCCRMLCFSVDICVLSATGNETKSVSERETLPDDAAVPTRKAGETSRLATRLFCSTNYIRAAEDDLSHQGCRPSLLLYRPTASGDSVTHTPCSSW
jgi:hypothetical protein